MRVQAILAVLGIGGLVALTLGIPGPGVGPAKAADIVYVAAGGQHTCALTTADGVQCWGRNDHGQLGDGTNADSATPVSTAGLDSNVSAIAVGSFHSCAVTATGGLKCWGRNVVGQLGDGTTTNSAVPVDVCASGSGLTCNPLLGVASVAAGEFHTCAVSTLGGVKCWGWNSHGQLGDGTTTDRANPVDVVGLASGVSAADAGGGHTCALTTTGDVKCWGRNDSGQLGNGTTTNSSEPVDVYGGRAALVTGGGHSCARGAWGGMQCWGANRGGQLGDGTTTDRLVPTPVCETGATGQNCSPQTNITSISAGEAHTCAVVNTGGPRALKCWGWNGFGQLGDGTRSWNDPTENPVFVSGLSGAGGEPSVAAGSPGSGHSCARLQTGIIKCWGWNSHGQLGDGTTTDRLAPPMDLDFDRDGCVDERELGSDATQGGLRNPKYFWDFYDTPDDNNVRDRVINQADIDRVLARYGAKDDNDGDGVPDKPINRNTDPLSPPPAAPAYHPAYDRGAQIGPNPWDRAPPDGIINLFDDIIGVANQNGHSCA